MAYDLLIKNGRVVDGSGGPSFRADVAIKDGKIVGVGKFSESATRTINADGRVVAPGFIDHHTHYDPQALYDPLCSSTAQNGNTTVIVVPWPGWGEHLPGQGDHEWYMEFFSDREDVPLTSMRRGIDFTWESIAEYLDALGRKRGVNAGALIGHSGLRRYVMGEEASDRVETTPEEIEAMKRLTREGILAGALGFSTGSCNMSPCGIATDEERFALASVLGELGTGIFQVSGGSTGGVFGPLHLAKELSIRTGRPAIYNLVSQQITAPPDEWKEPPGTIGGGFQGWRQSLRLLPVGYRRAHLQPETGAGYGARRRPDQPAYHVFGNAHLGLRDGPAGAGAYPVPPRSGDPQGAGRRSGGRYSGSGTRDRTAGADVRGASTGAGTWSRSS